MGAAKRGRAFMLFMLLFSVFAVGRKESVLLLDGTGGCTRLKLEWMGVGMRPEKESRPGELSLSGRRWTRRCGCVNGEGGDAEPAMETSWSMFISTSPSSGGADSDMNEAGELPLLESVGDSSVSGVSKIGGGGGGGPSACSNLNGSVCARLIDGRGPEFSCNHAGS